MSLTQLWFDSRVNSRSDRFLLRALATAGPLTGLATMLTPTVRWVQRCQPLMGEFDSKPWIFAIINIFRKVFRSHGEFCATQPWEVMIRKSRENVVDSEVVRWSWQRSPSSCASSPCGGSTVSRWPNIQSLLSLHILLPLRFLVSPPPLLPHGAWWSWWWWPSSGDQPSCSELLM